LSLSPYEGESEDIFKERRSLSLTLLMSEVGQGVRLLNDIIVRRLSENINPQIALDTSLECCSPISKNTDGSKKLKARLLPYQD